MVFILAFLACPGGSKDSDSSGGSCSGAPQIADYNIECYDRSCEWWVEADAPIGRVEMTVTETADPTSTCGPAKGGKGDVNECGVWQETHTGFSLDGAVGACGERQLITLEIVYDYRDQVDNRSTLFDRELGGVTALIEIYDQDGNYADCRVTGHDPGYFSNVCSNVD